MWYWYSFTVIVLLFCSNGNATDEGDFCTTEGADGRCLYIIDCPKAIENLRNGKHPRNCGFIGSKVLVCCPIVTSTEERSGERVPGVTAKEKCKEYAKYVYTNKTIPHPLIGREPINVSRAECGFTAAPLVSGGTEARQKEFPHMAAIGFNTSEGLKYLCGGSLISELYVLTAAHCVNHREFGKAAEVKLGATQLTGKYSGTNYRIADHICHPNYKSKFYYDIALLKMAEPARLFARARPACLFTSHELSTNRSLVSGWGREFNGGPMSDSLLRVVVDIFDNDRCNRTFRDEITSGSRSRLRHGILDEDHICAGSEETRDACQGDSGEPMQIYHNPDDGAGCMYDIVGIVSFGNACGEDRTSGVYTRVSTYVKWIEDIVWP